MRNKLRCSLLIFLSKPGMSLFIAFELFVLIAAANFALGQYNSRTMLYEPVASYIQRQGFMVQETHMFSEPENAVSDDSPGVDTVIITEDNNEQPKRPKLTELLDDIEVMTLKHFSLGEFEITVIPDDVFDKLRLPVDEGSLFKSGSSSETPRVIVTPNTRGYSEGNTVTIPQEYIDGNGNTVRIGDDLTVKIAAVLTDPTYIMHFTYSANMSFENMYLNYDQSYYQGQFFCYTCQSEFDRSPAVKGLIAEDSFSLVSFTHKLTEEEYSAAKTKLEENGYNVTENSVIEENSRKKLSDEFKKLLPAVFAFGVVVLIGIISCSFISAKTMLKKLAIFYCCGATKTDCIFVSVGQTVVISLIAVIASAGAMAVFILTKLSNKVGCVLGASNLIISAGIVLGAILISAIAPVVLISKAEPRELLTETAEE